MTWRMAAILIACGLVLGGCAAFGFGQRTQTPPGKPGACGTACQQFLNR